MLYTCSLWFLCFDACIKEYMTQGVERQLVCFQFVVYSHVRMKKVFSFSWIMLFYTVVSFWINHSSWCMPCVCPDILYFKSHLLTGCKFIIFVFLHKWINNSLFRPGTHYPHVTWPHVMLRPGTHYPHVTWAHVMLTRAVGMWEKNRASYIKDGRTAALQMLHFIYIYIYIYIYIFKEI